MAHPQFKLFLLGYGTLLVVLSPFLNLPAAISFSMDDFLNAPRNLVNQAASGNNSTPLPVPDQNPPIGNNAAIAPCAAPPSAAVAQAPSPVSQPSPPVDRRVATLTNLRPGQTLKGLNDKIGYPDDFMPSIMNDGNGAIAIYNTRAGTYRLTLNEKNRVVAMEKP